MTLYQVNPGLVDDIYQVRISVCEKISDLDTSPPSYVCKKTIILNKVSSIEKISQLAFAKLHHGKITGHNDPHIKCLYLIPWEEQIHVGFLVFILFPQSRNNSFPDLVPIS